VIDAFVDALNLTELDFDGVSEATGRLGYHPALMLRLYLYGQRTHAPIFARTGT